MKHKSISYLHFIGIAITFLIAILIVFKFTNSFFRLYESLKDIFNSFIYYVCELLGILSPFPVSVNNLPELNNFGFFNNTAILPNYNVLPSKFDIFQSNCVRYWSLFFSSDNFFNYVRSLNTFIYNFSYIILLILPVVLIIYMRFCSMLKKKNNDYNVDSKYLIFFRKFIKKVYIPIKDWLINFINFLKTNYYLKLWLFLSFFAFNFFAIIFEFIAFYLYLISSLDFFHIYIQIYKLFIDLSVLFKFLPGWCWVVIAFCVLHYIRIQFAIKILNHNEMKNRGFINDQPIVYMVCGTMGKKKTTIITDMALSQEVMFRDKAFKKILENDLKFPNFPWINLENEIKRAMKYHQIYNLSTCKKFIECKYKRWVKSDYIRSKIFDYDTDNYPLTFNNSLYVEDLWDVLETYTQLYFIYVIQSSLLISNYSIRVDNVISSCKNFPLWHNDFFSKDSRLLDSFSRHSHILDFDALRLGKKVVENNIKSDSFEFGVIVLTEIGKERGNNLELIEKKKKDDITNQKNDLFNSWLKMIRHSATIDNFPFVRVITDEQRPESWGADARDLCNIINIEDSSSSKLAFPFFAFEELLYTFVFSKFSDIYYKYRFSRSDNTLTMFILKKITSTINNYHNNIYNNYGYSKVKVRVENGTRDGKVEFNYYYLANKKIYSKRFSSDCYSDFFTKKGLRSSLGINDLVEYETVKASLEELAMQNSYFVNDLIAGFNKK